MHYAGIDYHKSFSHISVVDEKGHLVLKGRVDNNRESIHDFFSTIPEPLSAVLESCRNYLWMHEILEQIAENVTLAHPLKVKAIASAKIKTDAIDSRILANLLRADLIPEAHVPTPKVRLARQVLRQRMFFVRMRTQVKNRIHDLVDRHPELHDTMVTDLFGKAGMTWLRELPLPEDKRRMLGDQLSVLDELNRQISRSDKWVRDLSRDNPDVALLRTIPGIGPFFALLLWAEIDGIERFASWKKLSSYAGLVPSTYSSGGHTFHGRLTKQGNKWIRFALVEAVFPALRSDFWLKGKYEYRKRRDGANRAKIVIARLLLKLVFRVLKEQRPYKEQKQRTRENMMNKNPKIPVAPENR